MKCLCYSICMKLYGIGRSIEIERVVATKVVNILNHLIVYFKIVNFMVCGYLHKVIFFFFNQQGKQIPTE